MNAWTIHKYGDIRIIFLTKYENEYYSYVHQFDECRGERGYLEEIFENEYKIVSPCERSDGYIQLTIRYYYEDPNNNENVKMLPDKTYLPELFRMRKALMPAGAEYINNEEERFNDDIYHISSIFPINVESEKEMNAIRSVYNALMCLKKLRVNRD